MKSDCDAICLCKIFTNCINCIEHRLCQLHGLPGFLSRGGGGAGEAFVPPWKFFDSESIQVFS